MIPTIRAILIAAALLTISMGAAASVLTGYGYACSDTTVSMPDFAFLGGFDLLPSGNFVVNDGYAIREIDASGADVRTLYSFSSPVMGSFVRCNSNTLYFGESTTGSITALSLRRGAKPIVIASLASNFDMDFNKSTPYVVAGSSIYALNKNGTASAVASAPGYSGPIAFNRCGDLFYAPSQFPSSTSIIKWDRRDMSRGSRFRTLGAEDALAVAPIGGAYGFAFDRWNRLLFTDNSGPAPVLMRFDGRTMTTLATFNIEGANFPSITFVRVDQRSQDIYVGVAYYSADWMYSYTYITRLRDTRRCGAF